MRKGEVITAHDIIADVVSEGVEQGMDTIVLHFLPELTLEVLWVRQGEPVRLSTYGFETKEDNQCNRLEHAE